MTGSEARFDFGVNWLSYSRSVLDEPRVAAAEASLREILEGADLAGKTVLDVGCGSGLFAIAAARLGAAQVTGLDISEASIVAAELNAGRFLPNERRVRFRRQDILQEPLPGDQDIVYAWGSLHHTGRMWDAIERTAEAVRPGGLLALALYNRHWTSSAWSVIKRRYNRGSVLTKKLLLGLCWPPIFLAKTVLSGEWSLRMRRGMDFRHDVIDWVGGYPYEYASVAEVAAFLKKRGFELLSARPTRYGAGNNEFLLRRTERTASR